MKFCILTGALVLIWAVCSKTASLRAADRLPAMPTNEDFTKREYPGGPVKVVEDVGAEEKVHRYIISYPSEGLKLQAVLSVPTSPMPREGYPLVILNHGYYKDPKEYKALKSYIPCESFFAEHGYVVVKPDYRGHGDSDGPAYPNGYAPGTIADMLNLIASMKKDERVNAKRIYTIGHSIGGLFSLQCAEISPDIKAVVDYAGSPADPRLRHMLRPKASEEVPSFDFQFEQIRSHVKALRVPVQIHNGTADNAMPFQFSENFYELLKSSGKKDVEFFAYQGGGHHLQGADQELLFERALALFENKPRPRAPQMGQGQLMPNMPGQMQSRRPGMGGGGTLPPGMGGGRGMMPGMGGGPLPGMGGGGGGPFPGMGPVPGMGGPYTPFPPGGFYPRPIYPYPPNRFPPG